MNKYFNLRNSWRASTATLVLSIRDTCNPITRNAGLHTGATHFGDSLGGPVGNILCWHTPNKSKPWSGRYTVTWMISVMAVQPLRYIYFQQVAWALFSIPSNIIQSAIPSKEIYQHAFYVPDLKCFLTPRKLHQGLVLHFTDRSSLYFLCLFQLLYTYFCLGDFRSTKQHIASIFER